MGDRVLPGIPGRIHVGIAESWEVVIGKRVPEELIAKQVGELR
jgi:hypothetical protein